MKKLLLTTIGVFFTFACCLAQDVILLSNGDDLDVRVLEISNDEIKYKLPDSLDENIYTMSVSDAWMVRYEDGESIVLKKDDETSSSATAEQSKDPDAYLNQKPVTIAGKALEVVFSPLVKIAKLPSNPSDTKETPEPSSEPEKTAQPGSFLTGLFIEVGLNLLSDWLSHGNAIHVHW